MDKATQEIVEVLADVVNGTTRDVSTLQETMAGLKLWFRQELAKSVEDAKNELVITMHQLTAQSIHDAKARAQAAEKELADLQGLLAKNGGQTKTVRLVHDEAGKTLGAVITERTN